MSMNRAIRMKSVSVIVHKQDQKCCHVVNITVHSVSITWTVWMTVTVLKYRMLHFLCMPYIHFKSTNLHITVYGILIKRDWIGFTDTLLLVVWPKNTLQRHCDIEKKKKYGHKVKNTNYCNKALLLHAALYEELQRTGLSLVDRHSLVKVLAQSMANLQEV